MPTDQELIAALEVELAAVQSNLDLEKAISVQRSDKKLRRQVAALEVVIAKARRIATESDQGDSFGPISDALTVAPHAALDVVIADARQAAVLDYVRTKEVAKVKVEFTNQPIFDQVIADARREGGIQALDALEKTIAAADIRYPGKLIATMLAELRKGGE